MSAPRVPLGELLVEAQVITREQLAEVLEQQKTDGRRLGTLLVESGLVTETQVTQILSQQLSVPWVSLYHIDFSRQLLDLVPREVAEKHCLVPIFVRRVRGQGNTLYVAMDDPANQLAQDEVGQFAGLPVRAMIAPPDDIRSAIRVYYGGDERAGMLSEAMVEDQQAAVERQRGATAAQAPPKPPSKPAMAAVEPERSATPPPESGPAISAREIEMPAPRRGAPRKMISLTLLDGTQIKLPAKSKGRAAAEAAAKGGDLTARDLVAALRAVAHGADASEILGEDVHWEAMFAALLSVLMRKHLIADWEFVEEYKKI